MPLKTETNEPENDYTPTQPHHTPHTHSPMTLSWHQGAENREGEKDNEKGSAEIILASCISDDQ